MEHKGTQTLETSRLILRKFVPDDVEAVYKNWTSDERVTKFLRWPAHKDISVTKRIVSMWLDGYSENNFYQWAIVPKETDEPIGTISVVEQKEELGIMHIGYCIGFEYWHCGFTSEAFSRVIAFLFEEVKANRIESQHDPANPNSGKVMEKCSLKYEGTLRKADINNTGIVDAAMYSILADEYFAKH